MLIKSKLAEKNKSIAKQEFPKLDKDGHFSTSKFNQATNLQQIENEFQNIKELGFQNGERVGYEKGLQAIEPHIEHFSQLISSIQQQQEEVISGSEQFVINFAFKIVEKIMGFEEISNIIIDRNKLQSIVEEALNQFSDTAKYIIRVHKDTAEFLEQYKTQFVEKLSRPVALTVIEDPSLKPSECLIESEHGVVDARIDSQIKEIKNIFVNKESNGNSDKI